MEIVKKEVAPVLTFDELDFYIDFLNNFHEVHELDSREKLAKLLTQYVETEITVADLDVYYSPTLSQIIEDKKLISKHAGIVY